MIQQTDKTDKSHNQINEDQNEEKIFAHRRHDGNIKIEYKDQTAVNDQNNDIRRKNQGVKSIQHEEEILFSKQIFWNEIKNHKI